MSVVKTGMPAYMPSAPLLALFPTLNNFAIAKRLNVHAGTVTAWRKGQRLKYLKADRIAVDLGLHPYEIWGDEWWKVEGETES
jgi:hypothetical protein